MAYPAVGGPYGFLPVNLLGGQVYAGSTRQLPIASGYAKNIGFGDLVSIISDGTINRVDSSTGAKTTFALKPVGDRKSTRLNSSHIPLSRMPSSA